MPAKREWRKSLKKQQRQRRRQKYARDRDKKQEEAEKQPEYRQWLKHQAELEEFQRLAEERQQQADDETWLRREALAQQQFRLEAAQRRQQETEVEKLRAKQAEELAALQQQQRQQREERQRLADAAAAEFEAMMQRMQEYMEQEGGRNSPPAELRRMVETHPGDRLCEFYTRTNCCRYGSLCTFNHRRPMLARILLIRHFFSHPLLLQAEDTHKEYANADERLELTDVDLRSDYDDFFNDVVAELEKFGKIINFRTVRNVLPHLRGHVFVEYAEERFALRAFVNLQGRYYASKRLNVEFSNLKGWRGAVCGLSLTRKCPKSYSCGYLHLFRNPNNLFNGSLEINGTPRSARSGSKTPTPNAPSWNDNERQSRNWRWSESPELELENSKSLSNSPKSQRRSSSREDSSRKHQSYHSSRNSRAHHNRHHNTSSHERSSRRDNRRSRSPPRQRQINQSIT